MNTFISVTPTPHWANGWFLRVFAAPVLLIDGVERSARWGHPSIVAVDPGDHRVSVGARYRGTRSALGAVDAVIGIPAGVTTGVTATNGILNHQPFVMRVVEA